MRNFDRRLQRLEKYIPNALAEEKVAAEVVAADSLMGRIQQLEQEAARLAKKAEARGDIRTAIAARRELMRIVELLAKIQMADNAQVSKNIGPSIRIVVEPLIKPSDMQPEPIEGFAVRLPD